MLAIKCLYFQDQWENAIQQCGYVSGRYLDFLGQLMRIVGLHVQIKNVCVGSNPDSYSILIDIRVVVENSFAVMC